MGMVGKLFEDKLHVASLVIGTDESGDPKIVSNIFDFNA